MRLEQRHLRAGSAHVIAAVRPASPPPMTVISFMAGTVRAIWPCVQFQLWDFPEGQLTCWSSSTATASSRCTSSSSGRCAPRSATGACRPARGCPSSRGLAAELGISRGVVTSAYGQLAAEGYLETRQGAPVRSRQGVRAQAPRPPAPSLHAEVRLRLRAGLPDLAGFPRDRWLRSLRAAWRETPLDAVGYGDPRGVPELREALADYLARVRGAMADPEHMIVCTGFRQGLSLTCRWLRANGIEHVALEDPGWHAQRLIVEEAGLRSRRSRSTTRASTSRRSGSSGADAVVVTPAHQFPTGVVLSARRRAALIEWADRGDRLIIEDDYDAELCRERVGALQGIAPDRVLYIGSASKRLTPGYAHSAGCCLPRGSPGR